MGFESLSPGLLAWAALVILAAGLIQGALGFGFPFVATPLIAMVSDMRTAIIAVLLPTLATILVALAASAAECGATDSPVEICAPTVGTFYRAPQPGAAPFVSEGDEVRRGQQIGIVEAMKLMIPVESEHDGVVATIHIADNTPVEYGQPLITLSPVTG